MKKILLTSTLLVAASTAVFAQNLSTRFGALMVNEDHRLFFHGKPVSPKVEGNNSLTFVKTFPMGAAQDIVLVQDNGGTACPAQYHFVTVSRSGSKATKAFGTCSDLAKVTQTGATLRVEMPGYVGPLGSQAQYDKADRVKHIYLFKNSQVTETRVAASSKGAAFNPFTSYFPAHPLPKSFAHFQAFVLQKSRTPGKKVEGAVISNLSSAQELVLKRIEVNPQRLSFTTATQLGESFSFQGRFLDQGNLNRFSSTSQKKVVVLEGTARRFFQGKPTHTTKVKFTSQAGVS